MGVRRMLSGDANAFCAFSCPNRIGPSRGTVSLVALCFTAVIGISLASYITLSSRAMQLSNRSFQASVSKQLAEVGIEEALRAFNKNDWDDWTSSGISTDWTLDTTNKRATATMTFPAGKFGQGTTASVKIRVDNYDSARLGASWSSSKNYRIGDLTGRNGIWYRCVSNNSNQTPNGLANMAYWVPAPIPWTWKPNSSYRQYEVINYDHDGNGIGTWFRCTAAHTSPATWTGSNWTTIGSIDLYQWEFHSVGDIVYYPDSTTTWYRCTSSGTPGGFSATPLISWQYISGTTYYYNDLVCYYTGGSYNWYRCITSSSTGNTPTNTTYWENALSGSMHNWSTSLSYNLGDVVYHSGTSSWYRCIRANSGQTPSGSSAYWANTPLFSTDWESSKQYSQNDTVRYNGVWYLSLQNSNVSQNPSTATSYWIGANTTNTSYVWSNATSYSAGAYRCYDGVWYRCTAVTTANAGHTPNNTSYWTAAWSNSWGITTGASVVYADATVNIANSPTQKTQIRAPIAPAPLFPNAAGAATNLTITTGTGKVDSYDSQLGAYNAGTAGYSAVLAAGGTLAINGTTAVQGYLASISLPANISTGTTVKGPFSPVSPNLAPDRLSRSSFIPQTDIKAYDAGGTALPDTDDWPSDTLTIGTPGAVAPSYYYYSAENPLDLDGETLNIIGPVILDLRGGSFRMRNNGKIVVQNSGSLRMRLSRLQAESSSDGIDNRTNDPRKVALFPTGNHSNHYYHDADTPFHGVIYLPSINSSTNTLIIGSGVNVYGALSAKNITFNSEVNLHYDTSLRYATFGGVDQPYAVTGWRELPIAEQATMP